MRVILLIIDIIFILAQVATYSLENKLLTWIIAVTITGLTMYLVLSKE